MAKRNEEAPEVEVGTTPKDADAEFSTLLSQHICAGYQGMAVSTAEEARLELSIAAVAKRLKLPLVTWDIAEGFGGAAPDAARVKKYESPHAALKAIGTKMGSGAEAPFEGNNYLFVFRDLDDFFSDAAVRRLIRSLCEGNKLVNKYWKRPLVVTSSLLTLHAKIKPYLTMLDFQLPNEQKLQGVFEFVKKSVEEYDPAKAACAPELAEAVVTTLAGLTSTESENALARCLVLHEGFKPDMLGTLKDEKATIIKKSEVLTYIPEDQQVTRDQIGGFENLLGFIDRRRLAYSKHARSLHIDLPKGVVLLGIPGTGKSMVAMAVARLLELPGYIMDVGSVFGSLVGESEARMRQALKQVEAQRGCVLVLDEADKALGGAATSQGDSGVTRRIFGQLLSWLANKQDRTFVIMTLNRTDGLPPELLRAGRFDAVFYTDLPQEHEREEILKIHLRKRHVDPDALGFGAPEWGQLVEATNKFVGSEIEEVVREARYLSYQERSAGIPTLAEFTKAAGSITPLSTLDAEAMKQIQAFCKDRAKPVSLPRQTRRRTPAAERSRSVELGQG